MRFSRSPDFKNAKMTNHQKVLSAKRDQEQKATSTIQVKPQKSPNYGIESNARFINIRRPPQEDEQKPRGGPTGVSPGASKTGGKNTEGIRHNLWIFLRGMKWDP